MNMQRFIIPGWLPGLEEMIQTAKGPHGATKYNTMKKEQHLVIATAIYQARIRQVTAPIILCCEWVEKDQRRDKDNIAGGVKFILDALRLRGILKNDGWRYVAGLSHTFAVDPKSPHIKVDLIEQEV